MTDIALVITAFALAMDAFAVAIASGIKHRAKAFFPLALRMALYFGLFQTGMTLAGWGLGLSVRSYIEAYDHWVAFLLLACIGVHMIYAAIASSEEDAKSDAGIAQDMRAQVLLALALATSIDALAVGISLSVVGSKILIPSLVIGLVAFFCTLLGVQFGRLAGRFAKIGNYAAICGGMILILIGLRVLYEHGTFS